MTNRMTGNAVDLPVVALGLRDLATRLLPPMFVRMLANRRLRALVPAVSIAAPAHGAAVAHVESSP